MDRTRNVISQVILLMLLRRQRLRKLQEQRTRRRYWTHPLVSQRLTRGYFCTMYGELRRYPEKFFNFTKLSIATFDVLLEIMHPRLTRMDTNMRKSVSPEERLLVTLRFLASGHSFASIHRDFLLGVSTVAKVTRETCLALWEELNPDFMPKLSEKSWEEVARDFWEKTQFPNCIGALDGKHVRVKKPPNSGSKYFNYKKYCSLVLLGLVDAHLRFIYVDVGAYGSQGDSCIFRESSMGRMLYEGRLRIPPKRPLPGMSEPRQPFVIVADEAFGLSQNLMRPYSGHGLSHKQKIFNYRLSRARRMVECAFGVCSAKWRILLSTIQLDVENAIKVVLACCVLHNFALEKDSLSLDPVPPDTAQDVQFIDLHPSMHAMNIRNEFADFFMSPGGQLSWQNDHV